MQQPVAQAPMRRSLLVSLARDVRANEWFLPANSEQRMPPKGRYRLYELTANT